MVITDYSQWAKGGSNPPAHQWMNAEGECYKHIIAYYSALKRNEILTCAMAWENLEDIMQSVINQTRNNKCCMIPLR